LSQHLRKIRRSDRLLGARLPQGLADPLRHGHAVAPGHPTDLGELLFFQQDLEAE
jgi:hypothetical protein